VFSKQNYAVNSITIPLLSEIAGIERHNVYSELDQK